MEKSNSKKDAIFYEKIAEGIIYKFLESLWFGNVKHKKTVVACEGKIAVVEEIDKGINVNISDKRTFRKKE